MGTVLVAFTSHIKYHENRPYGPPMVLVLSLNDYAIL
jgi:hypothetical protein